MPTSIPRTPASRENDIALAREQVIRGDAALALGSDVQPWIQNSWRRCKELGFSPDQRVVFEMISSAQQRRSREANRALWQAAQNVVDNLAQIIAPIGYFAILTNAQGVVVASRGKIDATDRRATLITREAVDLSERAVGTTAIGAALAQQHDVWLHRGEHFFAETSCYSCAGSPIFGIDGQCIGMLDVTGVDVDERPQLMHLVSNAARRIENQLVLSTAHALVLHLRWPGSEAVSRETEGLICIDEEGWVCAMNSTARQMLGLTHLPKDNSTRSVSSHISEIFAMPFEQLFNPKLLTEPLPAPLWTGLQVQLRASRSGKLPPKSLPAVVDGRLRQQVSSLKVHEQDVIRDTVAQLKGNVAAAARMLGISRATVYRKLATHSSAAKAQSRQ